MPGCCFSWFSVFASLRILTAMAETARWFSAAYWLALVAAVGLSLYVGFLGGQLVFKSGAGVQAIPAQRIATEQLPSKH